VLRFSQILIAIFLEAAEETKEEDAVKGWFVVKHGTMALILLAIPAQLNIRVNLTLSAL
jgi:hypothetical protein